MYEVGRICIKIAGRDAGKTCVVVDEIDANNVLIDGETRRRSCNKKHLEPTEQILKIRKAASHDTVKVEFKKLGLDLEKKKKRQEKKPKQPKPTKQKKKKVKPESKVKKKPIKEEKKKTEEKKEIKKEIKKEEAPEKKKEESVQKK